MLKKQIQFAWVRGLFTGRIVVFAALLFVVATNGFSQATSWTGGGGDFLWTNPSNWSSGVPVNITGSVTIPADVASPITAVPTISLAGLTINGSCWLQGDAIPASPNTITVTSSFSVAASKTFELGSGAVRINFILSSSASGTINGTVSINSGATPRFFQNDGDLTLSSTGLINETASPSIFTLGATGTLRIGSPAGIT
ncbi:MAG: hypothetical protein HOP37_03100, partial [Cyclobacteriaceae bacterium]|nr:hypothetical protein [Cyclobacteriaceae bacterium]